METIEFLIYLFTLFTGYQFNVLARTVILKRTIDSDGRQHIQDWQVEAAGHLPLTTVAFCMMVQQILRDAFL